MSNRSKRAKLVLFPGTVGVRSKKGETEDDYAVYASYRTSLGMYIRTLKVVRLTDGRLLFPFEGAEAIGPFASKEVASEAAIKLGADIVRGDLLNPEL